MMAARRMNRSNRWRVDLHIGPPSIRPAVGVWRKCTPDDRTVRGRPTPRAAGAQFARTLARAAPLAGTTIQLG